MLVVCLVCADLPSAGVAAAAQGGPCATLLTLRGWQPALTLAGDVPADTAIALLRAHLRWQHKVITATRLNAKTRKIRHRLWQSVRDFDLARLYQTLPAKDGDWRSLTLRGQLTADAYRVSKAAPAAFDKPLRALGATATNLAMRPRPANPDGPGGDRYELRAKTRANIGPIAWANVRKATWMALANLTTPAATPPPHDAALVAATGSDAEILLQLQPAFAHLFKWYLGVGAIPKLLAHDRPTARARHLQFTLQLADAKLRERYPQVADYIAQLKDFFAADVVIKNDAGRWLRVDLDSPNKRLVLDAWVFNGHLVPSRDGAPRVDAIDTGRSLEQMAFTSVANISLEALGITVKLEHWPIGWRYARRPGGARYTGTIDRQPGQVEVSGRALGIIPAGLMNVLMPSNVQAIVRDFMHVLTHSNDGAGAKLAVDFADHAERGVVVSASADGNTLDNFFVHLAIRLTNRRILPDAAQLAGLERFFDDAISALGQDLDGLAAARQTAAQTPRRALLEQCRAKH